MQKHHKIALWAAVAVFSNAIAGSDAKVALPPEFSATLVHTARGKTMTQKLYVKNSKMRSGIRSGSKEFVTILDNAANTVTVLDDASKTFREFPHRVVSNPSVIDFELVNDPEAKVEEMGSDVVEGVACRKRQIAASRGVILYWTDSKTQLPVRMQSLDGNIQIDWKDVVVRPVADSLFEIPKGYTKQS